MSPMDTHPKDPSTLTRRRTIAAIPETLNPQSPDPDPNPKPKPYHTTSLPPLRTNGAIFPPPPLDLPLSPSPAYTSLKDLLPSGAASSINSPTPAGGSAYEVPIRNRLVKQAAYAYLQPTMSPSPEDTSPGLLRRLWLRLSSCFRFLRLAADAVRRIVRPLRVPVNPD